MRVSPKNPAVCAPGESTGMAKSNNRAEILGISSSGTLKAQVSKLR
jgi:hypothetical protein